MNPFVDPSDVCQAASNGSKLVVFFSKSFRSWESIISSKIFITTLRSCLTSDDAIGFATEIDFVDFDPLLFLLPLLLSIQGIEHMTANGILWINSSSLFRSFS